MRILIKNKKKSIALAVLGIFLILGMALWLVFNRKMDVDGNAEYINDVRAALTTLEENGVKTNVPYKVAELTDEIRTYTITTPMDWMALEVLSYETSLEEYTFYIQPYEQSNQYDLTSVTMGDTILPFKGIALNKEYPFKGNLASTLGGAGITLNLTSPLFGYLDASASINVSEDKDVVIAMIVNEAEAGFAQVLTGVGTVDGTTIKNINLTGTVKNSDGYAGGIFGEVQGYDTEQALILDSLGINTSISSVRGICAGGLIGKISGNVQITIDGDLWKDNVWVIHQKDTEVAEIICSVGALIGEVQGMSTELPSVITLADGINISNASVSGAGYTGGIIGKADYCRLNIEGALTLQGEEGALDITYGNSITDTTYSGGIIGAMEHTRIEAATDATKMITINTQGKATYMGGFAGYMKECTVNLPTVSFTSNYTDGTTLGGFLGMSEKSEVNAAVLSISDAFTIEGNPSYAGGVIGQDIGSEYTITNLLYNDNVVTVKSGAQACQLGGFAGGLTDTVLNIENGITTNKNVITATNYGNSSAKSVFVGGIIGKYTNNTDDDRTLSNYQVNHITIHAQGQNYDTYVGAIIGGIDKESGAGKVIVSDCSVTRIIGYSNNPQKTKGMCLGGIVGGNFAKGTVIEEVSAKFEENENEGRRKAYCYGGVLAYAGAECQIKNAYDIINAKCIGSGDLTSYVNSGIVGVIQDGVSVNIDTVSFKDCRLSHAWSSNICSGAIVGTMGKGSVLSLNGTIDLSGIKPTGWGNVSKYYGGIVGVQDNSLIYINPISYSTETGYVYGLNVPSGRFADEIGNYGSVYRNGNWDSETPASDLSDKAQWMIVEGEDTVTIQGDTDPYQLNSPADCMRLSIALNTENIFTGFESDITCENLLSGNYTLNANIDISNTGIQTLNKNKINESSDKIDDAYVFKGSISSASGQNYTITNSITAVHQGYLGLFSAVGEGASFSGMGINMSMTYSNNESESPHQTNADLLACAAYEMLNVQHFGAIAAYAEGNVTIDNVTLTTVLEEDRAFESGSFHLKNRYYGGAIGWYSDKDDKKLTIQNTHSDTTITISERNHYAGGLVGYVDSASTEGTINISNVSVTGTLKSIYKNNSNTDYAKTGGIIAGIGSESIADADAVDKKLKVALTNISVNGLQIQDDLANTEDRIFRCGGLIGYEWKNVDVIADEIYVNKLGDAVPGIVVTDHNTGSVYGGLWNTVWGHMELNNLAINAMNINVLGSAQTNKNGLLVGNGQYLYLELDNYKLGSTTGIANDISSADITDDGTNVTISDASALYIDEIVGYNLGTTEDSESKTGGVVSITAGEYEVYYNKVVTQKNPYTRYYYNLAKDLTDVTELYSNTIEIADTAKMLQWSLAHYVNQPLREFFGITKAYTETDENVTFKGVIDLGDVSYYPVTVNGGTYKGEADSKIIFHGKRFDEAVTGWKATASDKADKLAYTYENTSEHYRLQSGLFYDVTQVTIDGIVLGGSVTAIDRTGVMYSGALIAGTVHGVELETSESSEYINYDLTPTTITNIVLDNLSVSHVKTDDNWYGNYGLMVAGVGSGAKFHIGPEDTTSDVAGVTMINYTTADKVAAALIGQVGHESAQGINITFLNMNIADVADDVTNAAVVGRDDVQGDELGLDGSKVMAHASFIYHYEYQLDNTTGVYIFYLDDYKTQNVTLGKEIGSTVQFYDDTLVQSVLDYTNDLENGCLAFSESNYKPYVYQVKEIDVNPKNGDITSGCGTYDDPYIIETANQLMTLYYYLSDYDTYKNTLKSWEINAFGSDTIISDVAQIEERVYEKKYYNIGLQKDADDKSIDGASTYESLTAGGFPTVEQLSNAYYMITKDIDLTMETDFTGFGTEELPFTGVFVGNYIDENGIEDLTRRCQILMAPTFDEGAARYGFVKYAKGTVVRNIHFNMGSDIVKLAYNGVGAGVFAVVMGGDNVIDNVKVSGSIQTLSYLQNQYNASYATAGGYVGDLQKGSVILRGYQADALNEFAISRQGGDIDGSGTYQKGMIGKVQDGFVADDDLSTDISVVYAANPAKNYTKTIKDGVALNATDTINVEDLNNSVNLQNQIYDCIAVLEQTDKINVTQSDESGYSYNLDSAQDLLVVSFAINSGSMNYWGNNTIGNTGSSLTAGIYGYDKFSRCRTADYSYVGKTGSSTEAQIAYSDVIKYDNGNPYTKDEQADYICAGNTYENSFYRPYIFKYFEFAEGVEVLSGNTYNSASLMNQVVTNASNQSRYLSSYNLAAGDYDMSAINIKKCFKGIGAKVDYGYGNNSGYSSLRGDFKGAGSSHNETAVGVTSIKIDLDYSKYKDVALFNVLYSGAVNNLCSYEISGFDLKGDVKNTFIRKDEYLTAAGIAPKVYGSYTFRDVEISDMSIDSSLTPDTSNSTNPANTMAAAFVVKADFGNYTQNNDINFVDCRIKSATIMSWDSCGGFVAINSANGKGNTFTNCVVENSLIQAKRSNIGGFIGSSNYPLCFSGCELIETEVKRVYDSTMPYVYTSAPEGIGGFVGLLGTSCDSAVFSDCTIRGTDEKQAFVYFGGYTNAYYGRHVGGFVGAAAEVDWETVSEDTILSFNNCDITMARLEQRTPAHVGGFVGLNQKRLMINNEENAASEVTGVAIVRSFQYSTGGIVGEQKCRDNGAGSSIANMTIAGLTITQGWEYTCYTGGVIGQHSLGKLDVKNVHVMGTESYPTQIKFAIRSFNDANQKLYAGGLIGYSSCSDDYSTLTLDSCSFEGEENDGQIPYAEIINAHNAGGLIGGYSNKNALTITNSVVKNAVIQANYTYSNSGGSAPHAAGGGLVGLMDNGSQSMKGNAIIQETVISNVIMRHYDEELSGATSDEEKEKLAYSKSKTVAFGGLVGLVKKELEITDFTINGLSIGEDGYAGEAGSVIGMSIGAPVTIAKSETGSNLITASHIVAGVAGGVIGNTQREYSSSTAGASVSVKNITLENIVVLAKNLGGTAWNMYAGAVTGRHEITDGYDGTTVPDNPDIHCYENITVKNSVVSAYRNSNVNNICEKTFLGGMIGGQLDCEVRAYDVTLMNLLNGYMSFGDSSMEDVVPTYTTVAEDKSVKLYALSASYNGSDMSYLLEELVAGAQGNHVEEQYLMNRGMWIGTYKNVANSYAAKLTVSHNEQLSSFHPAIDVGVTKENMKTLLADEAVGMKEAYELYRDNIHLLYADTITTTMANDNLIGESLNLTDYYFAGFENLYQTKFENQQVDSNCDYRLDYNYMQNNSEDTVNYTVNEVYEFSYKTTNGYLSPYEWNGEKIPMLVSAGKYDINTVINTAINILTNNGGATNGIYTTESGASAGTLLGVEIERVKYQPEEETPFVIIDDGKEVIRYNDTDGEFSISATEYDSIDEGTFNLITVSYRHTDDKVYSLQLPIFIRDTVKISTHMKGVGGSGYGLDDIPATTQEEASGYSQLNVELNSVYTLYSEFIYSSAREEYSEIQLKKSIYRTYQNEETVRPFDVGTKITLLDITNNNMVYFYEITEENRDANGGVILFEDFKAMDNTNYETKDVSDTDIYPVMNEYKDICNRSGEAHKNVGLEQFLIIVDESNINATTSTIYDLYVRAEEKDNVDLFKNAALTNPCFVRVNEIPGLHKMIAGSSLYETNKDNIVLEGYDDTVIVNGSQISRESTLGLIGSAYIMSPKTIDPSLPDYWIFAETSNRSEYIELAISIEDNEGKRIAVPNGTMVTITLDGMNYGTIVASDSEYIYCYYDTQSGKPDPSYLDLNTCKEDMAIDFDILFDFSTSTDFSDIEEKDYHVTIELLDTPNANYPRNGEQCDLIVLGPVEGINRRNIGFALETPDILTLGMNAYNSEKSDSGRIAFKSRLDFSDYTSGGDDGLELLMKDFYGKYITYSFVLERKDVSKEYELFGYDTANRYESQIKILAEQTIEELDQIPTAQAVDTQGQVIVRKTVQYGMDIDKTADGESVKGEISRANPIMEEEYLVFADVEQLLKNPDYITNYKVTCYVTVTDTPPDEEEALDVATLQTESKAYDFFIFTVAKLKTDMN